MEHNQQANQGRRGHFHRARRGSERRGQDRREPPAPQQEHGARGGDHVDVEQIMRDIRGRIAQRHGIELSNQQVQELAARRLEAILDPRTVSPALLDQLRKSAGAPVVDPLIQQPPQPAYTFEEDTLFESHRAILRFIRRLLNPILKLFFNPNPLIQALNLQSKINSDAAAREAERERRQTEWNALHYELLQRMVTETARLSIEMQSLSLKIDSLGGKVDFNERRVRGIEGALHQPHQHQPAPPPRQQPRVPEAPQPASSTPQETNVGAAPTERTATAGAAATVSVDGTRRRRRRRRGRRGNGPVDDATAGTSSAAGQATDAGEFESGPDDEGDVDGPELVATDAAPGLPLTSPVVSAPPETAVRAEVAESPEPAAPAVTDAHSAGEHSPAPAEAPDATRDDG